MAYENHNRNQNNDYDLLPEDMDAERALLGAILDDSENFHRISATVELDDFHLETHRRIWTAMVEQYEGGGIIDNVTVGSRLKDKRQLESCGGMTYLCSLAADPIGSIMGVDEYISRLRKKAVAREAILRMNALIRDLQQFSDNEEMLTKATAMVQSLEAKSLTKRNGFRTAAEIIEERGGPGNFLQQDKASIPTPLPKLNFLLGGGFRSGDFIILAARPSMGKTALAMQMARMGTTAVFSLEQEPESLITRMICGMAQINGNYLRQKVDLDREERKSLTQAMNQVVAHEIYYNDNTASTVSAVKDELVRLRKTVAIDLVIIDYLQLMHVHGKHENRQQQISSLTRGLKLLAKELQLPFLVLSQLSRPGDETEEPGLTSLRESGSIEQDADIVMFLHPSDFSMLGADLRPMNLLLKKQRNGPIGTVELLFRRDTVSFVEETPEQAPPPQPHFADRD
jgi:replicative DNA helicase